MNDASLISHMLVHSEEKPFTCNQCNYSSTITANLKRKIWTFLPWSKYSDACSHMMQLSENCKEIKICFFCCWWNSISLLDNLFTTTELAKMAPQHWPLWVGDWKRVFSNLHNFWQQLNGRLIDWERPHWKGGSWELDFHFEILYSVTNWWEGPGKAFQPFLALLLCHK